MLRVKDLATLGNAASGLAAILLCVQDRPAWAALAIVVGYVFDVTDGFIARKVSGPNRFGAELDNLADHMTFGIAPAYCTYVAYRPMSPWLGVVLGGLFALAATVRHTRNLVYQVPTTLCWVGMPRPAAAFVAVAFVHSGLFNTAAGPWIGSALTVGLVVAILSTWPFVNHRGRPLQWWARGFIVVWAGSCVATGLLARAYFWDVLLAWAVGYSALSWLVLTPAERSAFFEGMRTWKQSIADGGRPQGKT